jgi:hypothetical protein
MTDTHDMFDPTTDPFRPELVEMEPIGLPHHTFVAYGRESISGRFEALVYETRLTLRFEARGEDQRVLYAGESLPHNVAVAVLHANGVDVPATERGLTDIVREQREENERLKITLAVMVEACEGITTEAIADGAIWDLIEAVGKRVLAGHNDTCGKELVQGEACTCGHDGVAASLAAITAGM